MFIALPQLENEMVHSFDMSHEIARFCMTHIVHVFEDRIGDVPQFRADKLVHEGTTT